MDKIASFQINHLLLNPGIYVSRKDKAGDQVLTTFDIRMTRPNYEPVMNTAEDLWVVVQVSILYWQEIMSQKI